MSGRLGTPVDLTADTWTVPYTSTATKLVSGALTICNRNETPVMMSIAIANNAVAVAPTSNEYVYYNITVEAGQTLNFAGFLFGSASLQESLKVKATSGNVSVRVSGYEEDAA